MQTISKYWAAIKVWEAANPRKFAAILWFVIGYVAHSVIHFIL